MSFDNVLIFLLSLVNITFLTCVFTTSVRTPREPAETGRAAWFHTVTQRFYVHDKPDRGETGCSQQVGRRGIRIRHHHTHSW